MVLGPNWYQIANKTLPRLAHFMKKKISILATLKVSSLAQKCVFYRPEYNTNGDSQGTEF